MAPLPIGTLAAAALLAGALRADDERAALAPRWSTDVRPMLAEHCFACHGPDPETRAAGLRLDVAEGLFDGLAPVVPGDADASELLYRLTTEFEFERMPPRRAGDGAGGGPSAAEIAVLRAWIDAGAEVEPHWAFAPLRAQTPAPVLADSRERSPIDTFVRRALLPDGLDLAPDAAPRDLVRRVHFDLVGLPPAPEVVERFAADPSDEAYAALVDGLLASDDFGVHQARAWLDAARYADSHGFTIDGGRSIWPWRDWVVDSINRDQPFSDFTVEQLAGDLMPNATFAQRIATGFHRNTQINQEGGAKDEENRISAVIDRVATTGSVWLGSTIACAQCHTHKFDPVTQTEYFGLYAFFDSTTDAGVSDEPRMSVPRTPEEERAVAAWEADLDAAERAHRAAWDAAAPGFAVWQPARATGSNGPELRPELDGSYRAVGQNPVYSTYVLEGAAPVASAQALRIEALPDGGPGRSGSGNFVLQEVRVERRRIGDDAWETLPLVAARADFDQDTREGGGGHYPAASVVAGGPGWAVAGATDTPHAIELRFAAPVDLDGAELRVELAQEHGGDHTLGRFRVLVGAPADDGAPLVSDPWRRAWERLRDVRARRPRVPTTLVLEERPEPRVTRLFGRGSFLDPRQVVEPHVPAALDGFRRTPGGAEPTPLRTRLDLARWLADPGNALVQRVTVNRWWLSLFGRGLVETENDFGLRGALPSHPGLLDWLAAEFVRGGMSRKALLREIVCSTTYRQSSAASDALLVSDPANARLARQSLRRLSGEALRDAMLAVAGVLNPTLGGPPVQPPQPDGVFAFTQSAKGWSTSEGSAAYRRSLYTRIWRSAPYPFYATFDAPVPNVACTRRETSTSPLQALALANDPMASDLAERFGDRIAEDGSDPVGLVDRAFRLALARAPRPEETERLVQHAELVREHDGEAAVPFAIARVVFNLAEFTHRP